MKVKVKKDMYGEWSVSSGAWELETDPDGNKLLKCIDTGCTCRWWKKILKMCKCSGVLYTRLDKEPNKD